MTERHSRGLFSRLAKTRSRLGLGLAGIFRGASEIDDDLYDELEEQLVMADTGVAAATELVSAVREQVRRNKIRDREGLLNALRQEIAKALTIDDVAWQPEQKNPTVILMVGVNGVGKTTTVAKLAHHLQGMGHSVVLAAGDTYRAAAIEQLQAWGQRLQLPVIAQDHGADAAAVAHDALSAAKARHADVLIIDTAGRQHTHGNLMDQLQKLTRVLAKIDSEAPHETWLTVDAGNGQNVLSQVEHFNAVTPLTGLCVTKLDGTAKGGVVIALAKKFNLPIRYIGVGEALDDLRPFEPEEFVAALLPDSLMVENA